jgi:putative ATPase
VIHLATAPKSNTVITALGRAMGDVRDLPAGEVPVHLRDSHYRGAAKLGHGEGYVYPHDDPRGWVPQQYRPDEVGDRAYYEPSPHGFEGTLHGSGSQNERNRRRFGIENDQEAGE